MAFWDKLFNRIRAETVPITLNDPTLLEWLGIDPATITYKGKNALKEATVFACVRILADAVGKLPVKIYRDKEGKQKVADHYLVPLLKTRPNPWMSARDFFKALETQRNIYGNSYAWIDCETTGRNAGRVIGLYPLESGRMKIYVDNVGLLPGKGTLWYVYTGQDGTNYKLRPDEVLHFKGLTSDGIIGLTPLEQLKSTVENAGSASQYINNSFKNGLQTKGIIHYVGDLSPAAEKTFREKFESMASGLKNANRVSLLPIGYQFQPLSLTMADAQFLENTQLTIKQIAAAFGVKNHQLNDLDRATHTNITEAQREFYIDTLMDILTGYEQELTYKLFTQKELDDGYYIKFNVNAILRADPKTRYEGYRIAIQSGFLTANEVRALEEMEAKDGGDRLLINGNMMPIEMAGEQYKKNDEPKKPRRPERRQQAKGKSRDDNNEDDLEKVNEVIGSLSDEEKKELGARYFYDDAQWRYIEEAEGEPIGFIENRATGKKGHLNCAVHPDHRGKGIADEMIDKAIEAAPELDLEKIYWITSPENEASKNLAEKHGFELKSEKDGEARYVLEI